MKSLAISRGSVMLPLIVGHYKMIPFNMATLEGLPNECVQVVKDMLVGIKSKVGTAYFTLHGRKLKKGETLRRGGAHTDGNYEPVNMSFGSGGGNGWKVGENGPPVGTATHDRQYVSDKGGMLIASNFESSRGWLGEYAGMPHVGGDCSHIELDEPFELKKDTVYYGNNHFIHESLPMSGDVHRVMARITLPEDHKYEVLQ